MALWNDLISRNFQNSSPLSLSKITEKDPFWVKFLVSVSFSPLSLSKGYQGRNSQNSTRISLPWPTVIAAKIRGVPRELRSGDRGSARREFAPSGSPAARRARLIWISGFSRPQVSRRFAARRPALPPRESRDSGSSGGKTGPFPIGSGNPPSTRLFAPLTAAQGSKISRRRDFPSRRRCRVDANSWADRDVAPFHGRGWREISTRSQHQPRVCRDYSIWQRCRGNPGLGLTRNSPRRRDFSFGLHWPDVS